MFRIGMKVVCIRDEQYPNKPGYGWEARPVAGEIYTIRHVGEFGVRLVEIRNPEYSYLEGFMEVAFDPERFRPIVEKKTDISWAEEILRRETINDRERV